MRKKKEGILVIRRKKNCRLLYVNKNYYLEGNYIFKKYKSKIEAFENYENIRKIDKNINKTDLLGRVEVELYQDDFDIILKSLEIYKFVINQNILISAEKEFLKKKNFDVDFLFQVLQAIYNSNYDFENKTNNIKRRNIC